MMQPSAISLNPFALIACSFLNTHVFKAIFKKQEHTHSFIVTNIVVVYILHTNQIQIHIPHTMRNHPQHWPASLCPSCRESTGAGSRPEARDLSGERQQSRPARATAGWMAGAREENEERSAQRERRGTPEDVEEHHEKMWEDKATDADWGGNTGRSRGELDVNKVFVNGKHINSWPAGLAHACSLCLFRCVCVHVNLSHRVQSGYAPF